MDDTIFALSSGPPPAGLAVVRISGPRTRAAVESLIDSLPEPRRATLRSIKGLDGRLLDQGLAIYFPGPGSFTGEDVVELHLHGGRAVVAAVIEALAGMDGLRAAEPGEFTRRAFLNRRLDLTEAEGLADLVAAETESQRRLALRQAGGELRDRLEGWRERLIRARALIEADLDFSDEEGVPGSVVERALGEARALAGEIGRHLEDGRRGERIRDGAEIVVLGPPNAGKSSLVNALARRVVAIVTPEPGTTRDLIEVRLDIGGYAVTLVDTAGLRKAMGIVEAEGIRRAEQRAATADLVLWVEPVDGPASGPPGDGTYPVIRVGSKADLIDSYPEGPSDSAGFEVVLSAETGQGMEVLVGRVERFLREAFDGGDAAVITRARHREGLIACVAALERAAAAAELELSAEEMRRAGDALGRITGRVDVEDLLDVIFREFCIGK
jgi:tRNA modification GTPase